MVRLNFVVEGQTEETFVNKILVPHLSNLGVFPAVRCVATRRDGASFFRGGISGYDKAKRDIMAWVRQDRNPDARFTTMFDMYGLPDDFPGHDRAMRSNDPYQRVAILEDAMKKDIGDPRLVPYVQLHEFEALLLSDPRKLEVEFYDHMEGIKRLMEAVSDYGSPELINLGINTAPSKRIIKAIPEYGHRKMASGPIIAAEIGLPTQRSKCLHFGQWLAKLEGLHS